MEAPRGGGRARASGRSRGKGEDAVGWGGGRGGGRGGCGDAVGDNPFPARLGERLPRPQKLSSGAPLSRRTHKVGASGRSFVAPALLRLTLPHPAQQPAGPRPFGLCTALPVLPRRELSLHLRHAGCAGEGGERTANPVALARRVGAAALFSLPPPLWGAPGDAAARVPAPGGGAPGARAPEMSQDAAWGMELVGSRPKPARFRAARGKADSWTPRLDGSWVSIAPCWAPHWAAPAFSATGAATLAASFSTLLVACPAAAAPCSAPSLAAAPSLASSESILSVAVW